MDTISVNRFRDNLKSYIQQVISTDTPLRVTRRSGDDFVVISASDWERERETLYVLQNSSLMEQIVESLETHVQGTGYRPSEGQLNEIIGV